ncbi:MAG: orotate phosphoribosyltransferase, partial [Patescibacteria group bacterium]
MAPLIPPGTEVLAGLEMGGIPIATALSLATGLPMVLVRKKAKDYGTCKTAEGGDFRGKRVCVVEDVVTTGGQIIMSAQDLREAGGIVENVMCVILRNEEGREKLAGEGLALTPLFGMEELKEAR